MSFHFLWSPPQFHHSIPASDENAKGTSSVDAAPQSADVAAQQTSSIASEDEASAQWG